MFSQELVVLVKEEQIKDQLREFEHQNLIKIAAAQRRDKGESHIKAVNWFGSQMVKESKSSNDKRIYNLEELT
jgi:hypothetical protein